MHLSSSPAYGYKGKSCNNISKCVLYSVIASLIVLTDMNL